MRATRAAGTAAIGVLACAAGYRLMLREWCLSWGATAEEAAAPLAGDDLLADPAVVTTRAVTVDAGAGDVWPWLVQMGSGRGGAYTYDWVENLFGLGMHSADRVLPEFQDLAVGDELPLGNRDDAPRMRVEVLEPARALVFRSADGAWVWAFCLAEQGGSTRLISRNRIRPPHPSPLARLAFTYLMEPGSLVMERKMLLGIRERAEGLARGTSAGPGA